MPKPSFQDIIPPDRRSIKKIPLPERASADFQRPEPRSEFRSEPEQIRRPAPPIRRPEQAVREFPPIPPRQRDPWPIQNRSDKIPERPRFRQERRKIPWRIIIVLLIAIAVITAAILMLSSVSGAKVVVTPKEQQIAVDAQFNAVRTVANENTDLQFQTEAISKDGKLVVPANGQETVSVKASGTIIIYNANSAASQKLVANTRFQTQEGLIFRITQPVTIPGKQGNTPGSVEATIIADQPGTDYNTNQKDFSIPGFKGDDKYTTIYGRSKTPTTGGFSGTRGKVDQAVIDAARTKINDTLKEDLLKQAQKDIPSGFIMPANAYYILYESMPNGQSQGGGVEVNQKATIYGFFFKRLDFAKQIAQKAGGAVSGPVDIANTANLQFTIKTSGATTTVSATAEKITFNLKGNVNLVSVIDTEKLKSDLAGKPRKSLNAIIEGYPDIISTTVTMRPFWQKVFPSNKNDIEIVVFQAPQESDQ